MYPAAPDRCWLKARVASLPTVVAIGIRSLDRLPGNGYVRLQGQGPCFRWAEGAGPAAGLRAGPAGDWGTQESPGRARSQGNGGGQWMLRCARRTYASPAVRGGRRRLRPRRSSRADTFRKCRDP
ncbi:hypothetical protein GCM10009636_20710 [Arthrobacter koreensis]